MSNTIKIKTGEETDVKTKRKIIDYSPLDTESREDDNAWNSMQFMCENDEKEAEYESPDEVSLEAKKNISRARAKLIGVRMVEIMNMKVV